MCGICGIAGPRPREEIVRRMCAALAHRGPDGEGLHAESNVVLGHRRLAIIDLPGGGQPMANESGDLWVVFNGEIYNFRELRKELVGRGHRFASRSDTEVLLHGYEEYGTAFFSRLDGIFAFALWDRVKQTLLLVRDYFGVKPLHWFHAGETLYFASELKALLQVPSIPRQADFQAIHQLLNLRYIPGQRTLVAGLQRLAPGHYLRFEAGCVHIEPYYSLQPTVPPRLEPGELAEGIHHYLREAVRKQLVSDVSLGVYLSGGLDSSAITALMSELGVAPLRSFALGFNDPTDELEDARRVADHFGTEHHSIRLDPQPLQQYPRAIWYSEEPKVNNLQGLVLAQFASRHVKVALGGLGGDELFAGYRIYQYLYPLRYWHRRMPGTIQETLARPLSRLLYRAQTATGALGLDHYRRAMQLLLAVGDPLRYYAILRNVWDYDPEERGRRYGPVLRAQRLEPASQVFEPYFEGGKRDILEASLDAEFHQKMVNDFLLNEDRTSMAAGLEVRVPFLDRDLVRFAAGIPAAMQLQGNQTKALFRRAVADLLPKEVMLKKKWGFTFDSYQQFRKDLKPVAERVLTRRCVEQRGWFDYGFLRRIMDHPPTPRMRWHYFYLWQVLGLELWCRMFLDPARPQPPGELDRYYDK